MEEEQPESTPADLWGCVFVAQEVTGTAEAETLMSGVEFTVSFAEGSLGAYAFCNQMGADVDVVDGTLVTGPVVKTYMACEGVVMDREQWVGDLLESQPSYVLDGETLTLTSGDITVVMSETDSSEQK